MDKKINFRCAECGRLLGRIRGDAEIKCPRCGSMNVYNAETGTITNAPKWKLGERNTSSETAFR